MCEDFNSCGWIKVLPVANGAGDIDVGVKGGDKPSV